MGDDFKLTDPSPSRRGRNQAGVSWVRGLLAVTLAALVALLGTASPAGSQGSFDAAVTSLEAFTKTETDPARFVGSPAVPGFDTLPGVTRYLRVDAEIKNGDVAGDLIVGFFATVNADCAATIWAPLAGDVTSEVLLPSGSRVLELRFVEGGLAAAETRARSRFLALECTDSDAMRESTELSVAVDSLSGITDIDPSNNQLQNTIQDDEGGFRVRATGSAAPAITTEPVVVATLTSDCVGGGGTSSPLTITVNELKDGTTGDPQPITSAVQNGTVVCTDQTTITGGTWSFAASSTGNVVEITAADLPLEGLGAADISVAFDSSVLAITACDTGDLAGACNPSAPAGPAQAAGFAAPAITAEPVVIATFTFDCLGGNGASPLTITVNELKDGSAGDPQPVTATVESGTVGCGNPPTISGGASSFAAGSSGNVVAITAADLPIEGLGAADITVAFDSAVLAITACDTGDLSGACNPSAPSGPAQAAGFAAPAITTEPVVITTLTLDCVGDDGTSSPLTITVNELKDGTLGDPQPITAVVQDGTVACGEGTVIIGGTESFTSGSTANLVEITAENLPAEGLESADISIIFDPTVLNVTACDSGDLVGACNPDAPGGASEDSDTSDGLGANILPDEDDDCPTEPSTPAGSIPSTSIPDPYLWNGCPLSDLGLDPLPSVPAVIFVSAVSSIPIVFDVTNFGPDDTATGIDMTFLATTELPCAVDWQGRAGDSEINDIVGSQSTSLLEFKILDNPDDPAGGSPINLLVGETLSLAPVSYSLGDRMRLLTISCTAAVSNHAVGIDLAVTPQAPQKEKQTGDDPATASPESPPGSLDECVDTDGDLLPDAQTTSGVPVCNEANVHTQTIFINPGLDAELRDLVKIDGGIPVESIDVAPNTERQLLIVEPVRNSGSDTIQNVEVVNIFHHTPPATCVLESGATWVCDIVQQVEDDAFFLDLTFNQRILDVESVSVVGWGSVIHPSTLSPGPPHVVPSRHGANAASGCESDLDARVVVGDNGVLRFGLFGAEPQIKVPKHAIVSVRVTVCPGGEGGLAVLNEPAGPYPRWLGDSDPGGVASGNEPFEELAPSVVACWTETAGVPDPAGTCTQPASQAPQDQTVILGLLAQSDQETLLKGLNILCRQGGAFVTEIEGTILGFDDIDGEPGVDIDTSNNAQVNQLSVNCISEVDASLEELLKRDADTGFPIPEDPFPMVLGQPEQIRVSDVVRNVDAFDINSVEVTNTYFPIPVPTCVFEAADVWACDIRQQVEGDAFFLNLRFNEKIRDVVEVSAPGWAYVIHPLGGAHGANNLSGCESAEDASVLLGDATFLQQGVPQLGPDGTPILVEVPKHDTVTVRVSTCASAVGELEIIDQPGGPYPVWKGDPNPAPGAQNATPFQDELTPSIRGCWKDTDSDPTDGIVLPDCALSLTQAPQAIVPDLSSAIGPEQQDTIGTVQITDDPSGPDFTEPKELKLECRQAGAFTVQIKGAITDIDPDGPVDRDPTNNNRTNTFTIECAAKHEIDLERLLVLGPVPLTLSDTSSRPMWMFPVIRNVDVPGDGDLPERVTLSLTLEGLPAGCSHTLKRLLPPTAEVTIPNGSARPGVFRASLECHAPAQPRVHTITITARAELVSGEPQINEVTPSISNVFVATKPLVLVEP